ncbi:DgyrCDS2589 [Dimorphilus gyrociliatus]|uniref:DgyrCDS2589 n=1 Tax=Dimorphilus gyrociliatus TaxID=2664684 RepID=A0A7I8VCJ3_9ANNE|nr:DgyrCDS2589 [Dimorphilus gyrociliatus]
MGSGKITDGQIKASSYYSPPVKPQFARLNAEREGGAWCPRIEVDKDSFEWLQIDFTELNAITATATQGRHYKGHGQEFTNSFYLQYRRLSSESWKNYTNERGQKLLKGNSDVYSINKNFLHPPIIARSVRFVPFSNERRVVCMRVELYGCIWKDALLSYSIRRGDKRGDIELIDYTYDGILDKVYLRNGLGQLVDGEYGIKNFRNWNERIKIKGYPWVGWKRMIDSNWLQINFQFDSLRKFSSVTITSNHNPNKRISLFKEIQIYINNSKHQLLSKPIIYKTKLQDQNSRIINTTINLDNQVGNSVLMKLSFGLKWILISEIKFQCEDANDFLIKNITSTNLRQIKNKSHHKVIIACMLSTFMALFIVFLAIYLTKRHRCKNVKRNKQDRHINSNVLSDNPALTERWARDNIDEEFPIYSDIDLHLRGESSPIVICPHSVVLSEENKTNEEDVDNFERENIVINQLKVLDENFMAKVDKIGECRSIEIFVEDLSSRSIDEPFQIIVKCLREEVNINQRIHLLRDISTLRSLDHSNILRLTGLIKRGERIIGTFTHCNNYRNLQDFLQENEFTPGKNSISYGALLYISCQLSSSLEYLESVQIVHGDVACRNCLIDSNYTVKLSDYAIYLYKFKTNYIQINGKYYAIRWTSWDTALLVFIKLSKQTHFVCK